MDTDLAITPGGRVGDASPFGKPGSKRKLTNYTREIAHALLRKRRAKTLSQAIAIARGSQARWAHGGGKVRPQVRAAAAKSTAEQHVLDHVKTGKRDRRHSEDAEQDLLFGVWSEALHPRLRGRFTTKNRSTANKIASKRGRTKIKPPSKMEHSQRKLAAQIAKENERQREIARQIVARSNLRMKPLQHGVSARPAFAPGRESRFRPVRRSGSFAEESEGDIQLGLFSEALHPRDWRGRFSVKSSEKKPDSHIESLVTGIRKDRDYRAHVGNVESLIESHRATHGDAVRGTFDEEGNWLPNRELIAEHKKLVDTVYRRQVRQGAAKGNEALFLGGLPGAGKTTALKTNNEIQANRYITINPDIFKEEMANRGLTPKVPGLSPLEASALSHEESSYLARLLEEKAKRNGRNIAHDITMNSESSVRKRLDRLEGYKTHAVFVDIPHSMSAARVRERHRRGYEAARADKTGTHIGQRLVPSSHVEASKSVTHSSKNREAFEKTKGLFGSYDLFDNSGKTPKKVESKR